MTYRKAVREAQRTGLDLIGVALLAKPPVLRLGNADKAAAAARQREKELRRKEVETRRKHTVKEVRYYLLFFLTSRCIHCQICGSLHTCVTALLLFEGVPTLMAGLKIHTGEFYEQDLSLCVSLGAHEKA